MSVLWLKGVEVFLPSCISICRSFPFLGKKFGAHLNDSYKTYLSSRTLQQITEFNPEKATLILFPMAVIVVSRSVQLLGIRRGEVIKMSAELAQLDGSKLWRHSLTLGCPVLVALQCCLQCFQFLVTFLHRSVLCLLLVFSQPHAHNEQILFNFSLVSDLLQAEWKCRNVSNSDLTAVRFIFESYNL